MEKQLLTLINESDCESESDYEKIYDELLRFFSRDRDIAIHWCVDYIKTCLSNITNISCQELLALPFVIKSCTEYCIVLTKNILIIANAIASRYNYSTISNEQDLDDAVDHFYDLSIEDERVMNVSDSLNILQSIIDERYEYYII